MKTIWNFYQKSCFSQSLKLKLFILTISAIYGVFGLIIWLIVRNVNSVFDTFYYGSCFIGFPSVAGFIYSIFYMYANI